jgi:hypothetical protein
VYNYNYKKAGNSGCGDDSRNDDVGDVNVGIKVYNFFPKYKMQTESSCDFMMQIFFFFFVSKRGPV